MNSDVYSDEMQWNSHLIPMKLVSWHHGYKVDSGKGYSLSIKLVKTYFEWTSVGYGRTHGGSRLEWGTDCCNRSVIYSSLWPGVSGPYTVWSTVRVEWMHLNTKSVPLLEYTTNWNIWERWTEPSQFNQVSVPVEGRAYRWSYSAAILNRVITQPAAILNRAVTQHSLRFSWRLHQHVWHLKNDGFKSMKAESLT